MHHRGMSQKVVRARLVEIWCMSVLTIGAWSVVTGSALTMANGALLLVACVVPPLTMCVIWRHAAPAAVPIA